MVKLTIEIEVPDEMEGALMDLGWTIDDQDKAREMMLDLLEGTAEIAAERDGQDSTTAMAYSELRDWMYQHDGPTSKVNGHSITL